MTRLPTDRAIYGLHAAEAALANPKRVVRRAFATENALAKLDALFAARPLRPTVVRPGQLDELLGAGAVHQGVVLEVEPLAKPALEEFLDTATGQEPVTLAMLDQVTDPHNVGAILRSASAFGIGAVITQARHSPPLSGALAKAASGGLEHVPVIEVVNLARALGRLKAHGFFCLGFDSEADACFEGAERGAGRVCFVFGAEDRGLRRLVREGCDVVCALAAPGPIKSLNVSNAAAIVFHDAAARASKNVPR